MRSSLGSCGSGWRSRLRVYKRFSLQFFLMILLILGLFKLVNNSLRQYNLVCSNIRFLLSYTAWWLLHSLKALYPRYEHRYLLSTFTCLVPLFFVVSCLGRDPFSSLLLLGLIPIYDSALPSSDHRTTFTPVELPIASHQRHAGLCLDIK